MLGQRGVGVTFGRGGGACGPGRVVSEHGRPCQHERLVMSRRTVLIGAAAALLALAGAALVWLYAMNQRDSLPTLQTVTVLVASGDIAAGTAVEDAVSAGLVEERELSPDAVLAGALASVEPVGGLVAVGPIAAGQQLQVTQWVPAGSAPGLAAAS